MLELFRKIEKTYGWDFNAAINLLTAVKYPHNCFYQWKASKWSTVSNYGSIQVSSAVYCKFGVVS